MRQSALNVSAGASAARESAAPPIRFAPHRHRLPSARRRPFKIRDPCRIPFGFFPAERLVETSCEGRSLSVAPRILSRVQEDCPKSFQSEPGRRPFGSRLERLATEGRKSRGQKTRKCVFSSAKILRRVSALDALTALPLGRASRDVRAHQRPYLEFR